MTWFLALPNCIDFTKTFKTKEEGLEYIRKNCPNTKGISLFRLEGGANNDD